MNVQMPAVQGGLCASILLTSSLLSPMGQPARARDFPVSFALGNQFSPSIDANTVVWLDGRPGQKQVVSGIHAANVYGKNLTSGRQYRITASPTAVGRPAISGDFVAWQDCREYRQVQDPVGYTGSRIFVRNLRSGRTFTVARQSQDQAAPAVSGRLLVWEDQLNGVWSIYGRDLVTGREFQVARTRVMISSPSISGNVIVWRDRERRGRDAILGKDVVTGKTFLVVRAQAHMDLSDPMISKNRVIWIRGDSTNNAISIEGKNLATGSSFEIVMIPSGRYNPELGPNQAISGTIVTWQVASRILSPSHPDYEVRAYDLSTHQHLRISRSGYSDESPSVSGRTLVWAQARRSVKDWHYLSSHIWGVRWLNPKQ